jgi:hypothetical protein
MYFEDLSPYTYAYAALENCSEEIRERMGIDLGALANAVNIGWLEYGYPFEQGRTPCKFRWKLRRLAKDLKNNIYCGGHTCSLCNSNKRAAYGHGEIHVAGRDGVTFVAPALIIHYIAEHKYSPPQDFIDAVVASGW